MLRELGVKNFVLIEELRLTFREGLHVFTGETGAGKSIIFDALGLLLGQRFLTETVRQGAERASIDGAFTAPTTQAFRRWWTDHDFERAEEILIRREGYADGRSKAYVNDRPVTLALLAELGEFLVDIHGQHAHQTILQPATQLALLDRFGHLEETAEAIGPLFHRWADLVAKTKAGQLSEQERMQRLDMLRFQAQDITAAKLKAGEDEELAARLPELKNAEKLRVQAAAALAALQDDDASASDRLGQARRALDQLAVLAPTAAPLAEELSEVSSKLDALTHALSSMAERWIADPEALESVLERLDQMDRLKKKYGGTLAAVIDHGERVKAEITQLENADATRADLEKQTAAAHKDLAAASAVLSRKRAKAAQDMGEAVQKHLADLGLKAAVFRCRLEPLEGPSPTLSQEEKSYGARGADRAVFEWAPNPGEGIQPLKAIISGGEMSRVMLALKTVLSEADAVPTLVFDEVDAGIGGLTALAVGKKLRALAKRHQVLCVSHLPQIASFAQCHYQVAKRTTRERTFATVTPLESDARLNELARLLGSQVTATSLQHARELLAQNQ